MNRTEIEWCDYANNPITGCTRGCKYCYAKSMAYRQKGRNGYDPDEPFFPTLHFNMLTRPDKVKKPQKIFSTSMGDFFDPNVPDVWRYLTLNAMRYNPQHTFILLTKQLNRMARYWFDHPDSFPDNLWSGITQDGLTTDPKDIDRFRILKGIPRKFISFEPLLGEIKDMRLSGIEWIIIGSQTGSKKKQPETEWVADIITEAGRHNIPVFLKDNLDWSTLEFRQSVWQNWPESMVKDTELYTA